MCGCSSRATSCASRSNRRTKSGWFASSGWIDLDRDLAADLRLDRAVDDAERALADLLEQAIAAERPRRGARGRGPAGGSARAGAAARVTDRRRAPRPGARGRDRRRRAHRPAGPIGRARASAAPTAVRARGSVRDERLELADDLLVQSRSRRRRPAGPPAPRAGAPPGARSRRRATVPPRGRRRRGRARARAPRGAAPRRDRPGRPRLAPPRAAPRTGRRRARPRLEREGRSPALRPSMRSAPSALRRCGDVALERVARRVGRLLAPDLVDQGVGRDDLGSRGRSGARGRRAASGRRGRPARPGRPTSSGPRTPNRIWGPYASPPRVGRRLRRRDV